MLDKFEKKFGREIANIDIKNDPSYSSIDGFNFYKKNYHIYFKKRGCFQFLNIFNEPDEIYSENWVALPDGSHEFHSQPNSILAAKEEEKRDEDHQLVRGYIAAGPVGVFAAWLIHRNRNSDK